MGNSLSLYMPTFCSVSSVLRVQLIACILSLHKSAFSMSDAEKIATCKLGYCSSSTSPLPNQTWQTCQRTAVPREVQHLPGELTHYLNVYLLHTHNFLYNVIVFVIYCVHILCTSWT